MRFHDKLRYLRYLVDKRGMKPVYVILGLTYECNSFCRTCFAWDQLRKGREHELTLAQMRTTLAGLGDLLFVVLSGGEPFLREDLPEVCELLARNNRASQITIPTGALLPQRIAALVEETLARCRGTSIVVNLSLDHVGARHDAIRGVPGAYERLKETYAALLALGRRRSGLTVNLHTCLCSANVDDLEEITTTVRATFPDAAFHSFELLRGRPPDPTIRPVPVERYREVLPRLEAYWRSYRNYDGFLRFMKTYSRRVELQTLEQETQVVPCQAGWVSGVIEAQGAVRLCELREPVGNLRDTGFDFGRVWFSPEAERQRASIRAKECHCTHSCFLSSTLAFDARTYGAWLASPVVGFLSGS